MTSIKRDKTYSITNVGKRDTATKLQVAGGAGLIGWAAVSIIPFFPLLMVLLVLGGVAMRIRS